MRRAATWLEERTGAGSAARHFFEEEIPASSGWHQVFGSMALFLLMVQVFTGILLAINYAPTPGDAYLSLRYTIQQVTAGKLIRQLHHWGSSMMIVVVVVHMLQVFLYGSYKKPREATWMVGVVLLLLVMGFGLTGYLLPWDNRAYWGTIVTTQIAGKTPLIGAWLVRLLGGDQGIGAITFARFYGLHVLVLPALTVLLTVVHVYLVRLHGVAPVPEETAPKVKFYPGQVWKDTLAIFGTFVVLFAMAAFVHVPLGRLADPTDSTYLPRPDWYFLFLFELLKFFQGSLEVFGAVILPGLAVLLLFLVPFLDRGRAIAVAKRTTAMAVAFVALAAWAGLTFAAVRGTPHGPTTVTDDILSQQPWQQQPAEHTAAVGAFRKANCNQCHSVDGQGTTGGPSLANMTNTKPRTWVADHIKSPKGPGSSSGLTGREATSLTKFMGNLDDDAMMALRVTPAFAAQGALLYQKNNCGVCHQLNGVGNNVGPAINGLAYRRSRDWVVKNFQNPQAMAPGTSMPAYPFPPQEMEAITSYLLGIPQ